nr:PREDICTED: putative ankyrin repeat domain-containing protein 31 [Latimeria chalumnae]|eukprot:XP_014350453.1 PREDICTED: putative ankyrin repeat domain-containing protein 31 [Latimeria chalumnae]
MFINKSNNDLYSLVDSFNPGTEEIQKGLEEPSPVIQVVSKLHAYLPNKGVKENWKMDQIVEEQTEEELSQSLLMFKANSALITSKIDNFDLQLKHRGDGKCSSLVDTEDSDCVMLDAEIPGTVQTSDDDREMGDEDDSPEISLLSGAVATVTGAAAAQRKEPLLATVILGCSRAAPTAEGGTLPAATTGCSDPRQVARSEASEDQGYCLETSETLVVEDSALKVVDLLEPLSSESGTEIGTPTAMTPLASFLTPHGNPTGTTALKEQDDALPAELLKALNSMPQSAVEQSTSWKVNPETEKVRAFDATDRSPRRGSASLGTPVPLVQCTTSRIDDDDDNDCTQITDVSNSCQVYAQRFENFQESAAVTVRENAEQQILSSKEEIASETQNMPFSGSQSNRVRASELSDANESGGKHATGEGSFNLRKPARKRRTSANCLCSCEQHGVITVTTPERVLPCENRRTPTVLVDNSSSTCPDPGDTSAPGTSEKVKTVPPHRKGLKHRAPCKSRKEASTKRAKRTTSLSSSTVNRRDIYGETPLHKAAKAGDTELVCAMIRAGAKVDIQDYAGWTALHEASLQGFSEVVLALLEAGANPNYRGISGATALEDAAKEGHYQVAKLLLQHRADPLLLNEAGKCALEEASGRMKRLIGNYLPKTKKVAVKDVEPTKANQPRSSSDVKAVWSGNQQQIKPEKASEAKGNRWPRETIHSSEIFCHHPKPQALQGCLEVSEGRGEIVSSAAPEMLVRRSSRKKSTSGTSVQFTLSTDVACSPNGVCQVLNLQCAGAEKSNLQRPIKKPKNNTCKIQDLPADKKSRKVPLVEEQSEQNSKNTVPCLEETLVSIPDYDKCDTETPGDVPEEAAMLKCKITSCSKDMIGIGSHTSATVSFQKRITRSAAVHMQAQENVSENHEELHTKSKEKNMTQEHETSNNESQCLSSAGTQNNSSSNSSTPSLELLREVVSNLPCIVQPHNKRDVVGFGPTVEMKAHKASGEPYDAAGIVKQTNMNSEAEQSNCIPDDSDLLHKEEDIWSVTKVGIADDPTGTNKDQLKCIDEGSASFDAGGELILRQTQPQSEHVPNRAMLPQSDVQESRLDRTINQNVSHGAVTGQTCDDKGRSSQNSMLDDSKAVFVANSHETAAEEETVCLFDSDRTMIPEPNVVSVQQNEEDAVAEVRGDLCDAAPEGNATVNCTSTSVIFNGTTRTQEQSIAVDHAYCNHCSLESHAVALSNTEVAATTAEVNNKMVENVNEGEKGGNACKGRERGNGGSQDGDGSVHISEANQSETGRQGEELQNADTVTWNSVGLNNCSEEANSRKSAQEAHVSVSKPQLPSSPPSNLQPPSSPENPVHIPNFKINKRNTKGETWLHTAAKKGDLNLVKALIKAGININQEDYAGWTALHEASSRGFTEVILELLKSGAEVNSRSMDGILPIHDAVAGLHHEAVRILLQHGANPNQKARSGKSAFDEACNDRMKEIIKSCSSDATAAFKAPQQVTGCMINVYSSYCI